MLEVAFVLAPGQNLFFLEFQQALAAELESAGVQASLHWGDFPPPRAGLVYVLLAPHEYFKLTHGRVGPAQEVFDRTVFVSTEQPNTQFFEWNLDYAPQAGALFDINRLAIAAYREQGIQAEHLQIGYTPEWDHFGTATDEDRDIDVLFMGAASDRRLRYLARAARVLRRRNCQFVISDNALPNHRASSSFLIDDAKWDLLRRTKVLLNIHQNDTPYFEWLRVVQAMSNGCVVVSEESLDAEPLVPGEHFASGRPEVLGHLVEHLLVDDAARERVRDHSREYIRARVQLSESILALADAARRLDRQPVPDANRGFFRQPPMSEDAADAAVGRLALAPPQDPLGTRRILKDMRLELLGLRRRLDRLEHRSRGGGESEVVLHRRSGVYQAVTPRISVLLTVYNYAHHVSAALDSLLACTERGWEVIIVDDGSADGSVEVVESWMRAHPAVPALLVGHPVNRGLARSRNAALDFARGPLCFVLDADNMVYPSCFTRLLPALDADAHAAFAYGMLERFSPQGPVGLMSVFPWAPERFKTGNYIDAMAMLRTDVLREFGGYRTDPRLYGWEDFDLWCRLAETGRYGHHVRSVVGRYRASEHSMLSITNISGAEATSIIAEACPTVMGDAQIPS